MSGFEGDSMCTILVFGPSILRTYKAGTLASHDRVKAPCATRGQQLQRGLPASAPLRGPNF
jgi:hypothetical protein